MGLRFIFGLSSPHCAVSSTSDSTVVCGLMAEMTIGAWYSSPFAVTTPRTAPAVAADAWQPACRSRPRRRAPARSSRSASMIAPMPPTGRPVEPRSGIRRGSCCLPSRSEASDSGRIIRLNGVPGVDGATWPPTTASGAISVWVSRRQLEFVHQVARIAEQDAAERFLVFQAREVAHEMLQRGRRFEDRDAEPVGEALQVGEESVVAGGLARREGLELGMIARRIAPADIEPAASSG